jgi:hypothetical protein
MSFLLLLFLENHPIRSFLSPEEIINWLDSYPDPSEFEYVVLSLSFESQSKWFAIREVPIWYSGLCQKISLGEDVIVQSLGNTDSERRGKIKQSCGLFIKTLIENGDVNHTMQNLLMSLMKRDTVGLSRLLDLFIADGIITEIEKLRLTVELNFGFKRWQTLGLSEPPTVNDV